MHGHVDSRIDRLTDRQTDRDKKQRNTSLSPLCLHNNTVVQYSSAQPTENSAILQNNKPHSFSLGQELQSSSSDELQFQVKSWNQLCFLFLISNAKMYFSFRKVPKPSALFLDPALSPAVNGQHFIGQNTEFGLLLK